MNYFYFNMSEKQNVMLCFLFYKCFYVVNKVNGLCFVVMKHVLYSIELE